MSCTSQGKCSCCSRSRDHQVPPWSPLEHMVVGIAPNTFVDRQPRALQPVKRCLWSKTATWWWMRQQRIARASKCCCLDGCPPQVAPPTAHALAATQNSVSAQGRRPGQRSAPPWAAPAPAPPPLQRSGASGRHRLVQPRPWRLLCPKRWPLSINQGQHSSTPHKQHNPSSHVPLGNS